MGYSAHGAGSQKEPEGVPWFLSLPDEGDFVIVWNSNGQDGEQEGVFGQRYNSDGTTAGSEFQVNEFTVYGQQYPDVASNQDGDFVVVWASPVLDGSSYGIFSAPRRWLRSMASRTKTSCSRAYTTRRNSAC